MNNFYCRVLIAAIRNLGRCACVHCCIPTSLFHLLGTPQDILSWSMLVCTYSDKIRQKVRKAREYIYKDGRVVTYKKVEDILQPTSLVPSFVHTFFFSYDRSYN
jgi:hypothetical protein